MNKLVSALIVGLFATAAHAADTSMVAPEASTAKTDVTQEAVTPAAHAEHKQKKAAAQHHKKKEKKAKTTDKKAGAANTTHDVDAAPAQNPAAE